MNIRRFAAFAASMALCGAAYANEHGSSADKVKMLDTDKDGQVSSAEFTAKPGMTQASFDMIDTNKDGFATAAEMDTHDAAMKKGDMKKDGMKEAPKPASDM